jgi:phosphoribosylformylglycinamidine synthase
VSGNVSLYNETDGKAIPPTPVVGGVGLIEDLSKTATLKGAQPGDMLVQIGTARGHLGASLYARQWLGLKGEDLGPPPPVDLDAEKATGAFVRELIAKGIVHVVHDVSDGGIACCATEMALAADVGVSFIASIEDPNTAMRFFFGERSACYLVAIPRAAIDALGDSEFYADHLGTFEGATIRMNRHTGTQVSGEEISLADLRAAHEGWMPNYMNAI